MNDETIILRLSPIVLGPAENSGANQTSPETVSGLVVDAVSETCQQTGTPIVDVKTGPALDPKSMMGVITYCYAKGILSATEIEQGLWKDDRLRGNCAAKIPNARTISRFRRFNRGLIQSCLENALRRVRRALVHSTLSQSIPYGEGDTKQKPARLSVTAPAPGEGTTVVVRKEAAQRLENATYLDSELLSE
ncbi:MAG TPA: transposase [Verrucomicrobiae bacterium]|nr:transposase [Verrucomicrobiae bacterium]